MGTILWTYKVNPLQPRNLISLVFMSQSSSGIDYEEFRPFEVGLTPLVANGSNLGVQLELKSLFPKEIRPVSMVLIFTFSPNLWSLSGVYHWIPHFMSFSNSMWNSKIRYTNKKLWPFEVGMSGPMGRPARAGPIRLAQLWAISEYENAQFQPFFSYFN